MFKRRVPIVFIGMASGSTLLQGVRRKVCFLIEPCIQMETDTPLRDLDVSGLAAAFPTRLAVGRATLMARLESPQTDVTVVTARREEMRGIRQRLKEPLVRERVGALRETMAAAEEACDSVAGAATDTRHAEYYNQLLWPATSFFAWLNENGAWNELSLFLRSVFLPGTSVVMPILLFAAPLVLTYLAPAAAGGGEPMSLQRYLTILQRALRQAMPSSLGKPRFAGRGGFAEIAEQFVHIGIAIAMFVASAWNQVSAALGLRRVAADMRKRAESVRAMAAAVQELADLMGTSLPMENCWAGCATDLSVFGTAWNHPTRVRVLLAEAGRLDMLAAVALCPRTCFPTSDSTAHTGVELVDLYHPGLDPGARVYNTVRMGGVDSSNNQTTTHVLLTGPNRGGKSTLLKALGAAVLMSQTVGVVFARKARLPIFGNIVCALTPTDRLGELSLFEAEIEFAKRVRATIGAAKAPVFLMMDEIFHGTNAHDGVEASQVFLDELYAGVDEPGPAVFSVVSTHYMELPRRYGNGSAQLLCMEASVDPADSDRLLYTYRLCPGVNRHSSVREILRERGLLLPKTECGPVAQKSSASAAE